MAPHALVGCVRPHAACSAAASATASGPATFPGSRTQPALARRYPEGGVNKSNSILGNMGKNCTVLDAKYTLEGMGPAAAPAPSTPAAPEGTATPAPTAGAAAASAPALLLAAAIAALMLF